MIDTNIILPSKPKIILEEKTKGIYEVEGLYPGYGHTLGNSLRRIILSSLAGTAVTSVKISGVHHEFSTIAGIKEDVVTIILNLKRVKFQMVGDEPEKLILSVKGGQTVTAADIKATDRVTISNPDQSIATLTDKKANLDLELTVEKGLGYLPKEAWPKESRAVGTIFIDAVFTPILRVSYEVENMRVGERTDFNRLRLSLETDGTITPREGLETAIRIMINQLQAVVGFREDFVEEAPPAAGDEAAAKEPADVKNEDWLKQPLGEADLSARVINALAESGIKTASGLLRKRESDLLAISGLGVKAVEEIKKLLAGRGLNLKAEV